MKKWKIQWMIALVLLLFGTATFLYQWVDVSPGDIRDYIIQFGWLAPLIYILLFTVRPLILFPTSVLSVAGGLAFGMLPGVIYTVIGATLSALVAYYVAIFSATVSCITSNQRTMKPFSVKSKKTASFTSSSYVSSRSLISIWSAMLLVWQK